ncbi:hypothetical protein [Paenibacillus durus]|uniref:Uncharacterized protein n=1 Tax=Paenibacillus durus ATCC 35681 TaxID=1333534 RepID=A0A0F7CJH0_PAEDU|nr:hypothetical protein [Paenibacillus durus]AKG36166.1 hypothetical protein VK70_17680 [Paenibacillus durus ATCC 35681]
MVKFQRSLLVKAFLGVVLSIFNIIWIYFNGTALAIFVSIPSAAVLLVIIGNHYLVSHDTVTKYFFGYRLFEIAIHEIDFIEFCSVKKFGQIEIKVASPEEDYYRLHLKNGKIIKIHSYYTNERITIGDYICKNYKVKKKETKKTKYFYGS